MKTPTVKFRGVSVDSEEVYFGFLFVANGKSYIVSDETFIAGYPAMWSAEVHPESVAQYIGMNDKNGKEIYGSVYLDGKLTRGGDTVGFFYKGKAVRCDIVFHDGMFCLRWPDGYINRHHLNGERYEILGSKFLNPELVKG